MVIKISHFCLSAKIEDWHHELITLTPFWELALGLVRIEASRTLGKWGSYCFWRVVELRTLFRDILERFWLFTQPLALEEIFRIEG